MDIDIDLRPDFPTAKIFPKWVLASQVINGVLKKHPCGIHAQNIPKDPISKLAAIPYKEAATIGYFKIDLLHNTVYNYFSSKEEIDVLLEIDPPWDLLKSGSVVKQLFQLSKHFDLVRKLAPKSVEDLADAIALIRPGKQNLLDLYLKDKQKASPMLYSLDEGAFSFKKSHSIAYAQVIVLQLHLINLGINFD